MKKARERERERKVSRRRKNGRESESSWIVGERERGGMSPMAATHHSQLNDAIFFPFSRFFSMGGGGGGGSPSGAQSNGVIQSSHRPGGTVLHQRSVCVSL